MSTNSVFNRQRIGTMTIVTNISSQRFINEVHGVVEELQGEGYTAEIQYSSVQTQWNHEIMYSALIIARGGKQEDDK